MGLIKGDRSFAEMEEELSVLKEGTLEADQDAKIFIDEVGL